MELCSELWELTLAPLAAVPLALRIASPDFRRHFDQHRKCLRLSKEAGDRELGLLAKPLACGCLEVALLRKCLRLSDGAASRALGRWGSSLRFLDLSFAPLGDELAHVLAAQCPRLRGIAFTGTLVTAAGLGEVVASCSGLEVVDLCVSEAASDEAVVHLAGTAEGRLKALSLAESEFDSGGIVTDVTAYALAERCPGLTCLDLSYRASLAAASLEALAARCSELRELQLTSCEQVSDAVVSSIAEHCASLAVLSIAGCTRVGDGGLFALQRCARMRRLLLWGCTAITDAGIAALSACRDLQELNVGMCHRLTPSGISKLALACPRLQSLYASGFGKDFVAQLRQHLHCCSRLVLQTAHVTFQVTFNFIDHFIGSARSTLNSGREPAGLG
mmetsp:Transcript_81538/g.243058  ORF Transcript_81538/g.243058 Transcript_81538/m.243058 type:complete len:390 (+) Transcript_81538:44-1213(+)